MLMDRPRVHRNSIHTTYDIKYHLVWIMKYRREVLTDKIEKRIKELIREICHTWKIKIVRGHATKDHVQIVFLFSLISR